MGSGLETIFSAFETAWRDGGAPDLAGFLPSVGDPQRQQALWELIRLDLEFRWRKSDENPSVQQLRLRDYQKAFPELTDADLIASGLIAEDYRVRRRFGEAINATSFAAEFHGDPQAIQAQLKAIDAELADDETVPPSAIADEDATLPPPDRNADAPTSPEVTDTGAETSPGRFGNYDLLFEIARGGMGVVYKAKQRKLNRIVALKMIKSGQLASADEVQRFYTEAEAAARLDHPNIVPVYDVGQENDQHYFSMGFVDGESLQDKLKAGPLSPQEAARLLLSLTQALAYAHQNGIVHRDLKPANVLIDADGQPRITDFGLAKNTEIDSGLTATGQVMGTPSYMPPEQAAGKSDEVGPLSDVYSLGAILYCVLTGHPPFQAASMMDTLLQVMEKDPVPPRQINPAVDADLETICLKCLQKQPGKRYATATELADDLDRYLNNHPIKARPVSQWEKGVRWCRRNPMTAGLSSLILLLLISGAVAVSVVAVRESRLREDAEVAAKEETQAREREEIARKNAQAAKSQAEQTAHELVVEKKQTVAQLYATTIGLAHREWLSNNIGRAKQLLAECPVKHRDWEWHYLQGLCSNTLATLGGHNVTVFAEFSRDGRRVLTLGQQANAKLWNWQTGQQLKTATGVIRISPTGDLYLQAGRQGLTICDAESGQTLQSIGIPQSQICGAAFSSDGLYLAVAVIPRQANRRNTVDVSVWESLSGRLVTRFSAMQRANAVLAIGQQLVVKFSPDGKTLATGSNDRTIKLWDISAGTEIAEFKRHIMPVTNIAFDPTGRYIASAALDGTARLWNLKEKKQERVFRGHIGNVYGLAFDSTGRTLATTGWDRTVRLWNTATGQELITFRGSHASVFGCAISPDNKHLVAACGDGTVRLWNVANVIDPLRFFLAAKIFQTGPVTEEDNQIAQEMVGYAASHINEESRLVGGHDGPVMATAISPDGSKVATAGVDRSVCVWDASSFRLLHKFKSHRHIFELSFSPDGTHLAAPAGQLIHYDGNKRRIPKNGVVKIWDMVSGKLVKTIRHETGAPVVSAVYSPDGRFLARATGFPQEYARQITERREVTGTISLIDLQNNREVWRHDAHRNMVVRLSYSSDGALLASSGQDGSVQLWDAQTGKRRFSIEAADAQANRVALRPDGKQLAMATIPGDILIWDVTSQKRLFKLQGHGDRATHLAYTPDGSRLISAGGDGTVRIWNPEFGQEMLTLRGHVNQVFSVAVSRNGSRIASGGFDGIVKVWDAKHDFTSQNDKYSELVFRDDFNRATIGNKWSESIGKWSIKDGALVGTTVLHSIRALNAEYANSSIKLRDLELPDET